MNLSIGLVCAMIFAGAVVAVIVALVDADLHQTHLDRQWAQKAFQRLRRFDLPQPTVEQYRQLFAEGPVSDWNDCIDDAIGMGFAGCFGRRSDTTFASDGTGQWFCDDEQIAFEWRSIGERLIEVRLIERHPPFEDWTDEELAEVHQWHRVEYDFLYLPEVGRPVIFDVTESALQEIAAGALNSFLQLQFLQCFGYRLGGPNKLDRLHSPLAERVEQENRHAEAASTASDPDSGEPV